MAPRWSRSWPWGSRWSGLSTVESTLPAPAGRRDGQRWLKAAPRRLSDSGLNAVRCKRRRTQPNWLLQEILELGRAQVGRGSPAFFLAMWVRPDELSRAAGRGCQARTRPSECYAGGRVRAAF